MTETAKERYAATGCIYDDRTVGVACEKINCAKCGWNPEVEERRKCAIKERREKEMKERAGKKH